ncbi:MAG: CotH kinase family protein [Bacteroidota bacterium]
MAQRQQAPKPKKKRLEIEFSVSGGFYEERQLLELRSPGAKIYYTTDGSQPNRKSKLYKRPIKIKKTTVIRAIARKGRKKSKIRSHTYFIEEPPSTFPVVSIAITPSVLFDPETGLYMQGSDAIDSLWTKDGANFWSKSEVKINTEIYEVGGECEFNSVTGFRLFGGMSRLFPQKSMTIVARDRYGKKNFKHRIFGKKGKKKYKFLVLRNSGSDWSKSHFRDALMTSLLDDWDIEKQDYRPAHLYLNGKYWGIYNIREKVNRYFISDHHEVDKDSVDLIEHRRSVKRGSRSHYLKMLNYLRENDLSDPNRYAYVNSLMDVDNFMDYQIAQIYFDNQDAGGNIKFWRSQTESGRWRWILYDTDWGFGLHNPKAYKNNSLEFHTAEDGPSWPNPPWSTFILRKMLESPDFEKSFVNRFADYLNTNFEEERVEAKIRQFYERLRPEMPRHLKRWKLRKSRWKTHVRRMIEFAQKRPAYVRRHLRSKFDVGELAKIELEATAGGEVVVNENLIIRNEQFSGTYFEKIPIHLKAVPNFGYRFSHWEGLGVDGEISDLSFHLSADQVQKVRAVFEPYSHPLAGKIMINEVSCNSKKSGDWIELFNYSEETIDLQDWFFTDKKNYYTLPSAKIFPKSYLIVCEDTAAFHQVFPDVYNIVGNLGFGLSKKKETLGLFTNKGASVDSMGYVLEPRDSTFTLGLLLPRLNNGDIENWEINFGQGTPNAPNPYYLESTIKAEQELWLRIGISIGIFLCCTLLLGMRNRRLKQLQKAKLAVKPPVKPVNQPRITGEKLPPPAHPPIDPDHNIH